MAGSICGCGTAYYGKRNFAHDGSYLTTEWITIFLVPIFPIRSLRVADIGKATGRWYFVCGWLSQEFLVLSKRGPSFKQVASTYLYAIGFAIFLVASAVFDVLVEDSVCLYIILALMGVWSILPWGLRYRARRKSEDIK